MTNLEQEGSPEIMPEIKVERIVDGLGFGEGSISAESQESKPGNEDLAEKTDKAIHSQQILIPIDVDKDGKIIDDDGCGDGRSVSGRAGAIFQGDRSFKRSLYRPKVFGGGATMAVAAHIGEGGAKGPLGELFTSKIDDLNDRGINFGAHIDNHAQGENCGCGAIDKSPQILKATKKYRSEITASIEKLGVDKTGLDDVLDEFGGYADSIEDQPYSGKQVMETIVKNDKVVKELDAGHLETRILLNTVEGYTVNQAHVRQETDDQAQAFVVDVWRLKDLAAKLNPDSETKQLRDFQSMLVYTLGTAAVLTKGDIPVELISKN